MNQYFVDNQISRNANGLMVVKTITILFVFLLTYGLILSNQFSVPILIFLAALHGFSAAQIGLNIGHDAIHGTYSSKININKKIALLFNLIGANDYVWSITHNLIHHTFTNIPDHDDDINQPEIIRVSPNKKIRWFHRFQHIYVFVLYMLSSLSWVMLKDFKKFFATSFGAEPNKNHPRKEYFRLFFYKLVYFTLFLVIPLLLVDLPWYYVVVGFLIAHAVEGLNLALVFHLAHLVEGTRFPEPNKTGSMENSWAIHQMYTTADFSRKSNIANWICGGLNFQIEHHLFPKICHIHYKAISPIVKQTALEFNIPFIENKTFKDALFSHARLLKWLGRG